MVIVTNDGAPEAGAPLFRFQGVDDSRHSGGEKQEPNKHCDRNARYQGRTDSHDSKDHCQDAEKDQESRVLLRFVHPCCFGHGAPPSFVGYSPGI